MRVKFCSGSIGVGNTLKYRRYQDHSESPLCKKTNKKVSHVLVCPDDGVVKNALRKITGPVKKILDEKMPIRHSEMLSLIY